MNTLRKSINTILVLAAICLSLCVLPAEAALPSGLQDVYTIFTTGIPPSNTGPDTPYCKNGLAYASWSSPDFMLSYNGGNVGGVASPGIALAPVSFPPTGAFIEYADTGSGFDTNLHWMKVTANNSTLGSFRLTQLVVQGAGNDDTGTYNIIGTKVGGGTVQTGNIPFNLNIINPPLTIDISTTPLAGQQITSFEIDFTMSAPSSPRPADFTFQSFTVSNAKAPSTVTGISPTSGSSAGGTSVVITGTNFTGATVVKFGSTNAASFIVNSPTQITATSPAGSGTVDITVDASTTGAFDRFTYVAAPSVTSISPTSGPTAGGTSVIITGTNLLAATSVKFGATNATGYTVNSATQITATSPAGSAGTVDITVITAGGTSATSSSDQFTYVAAPTVTNVSPASGPTTGGTSVTITGTNLTGTTAVTIGGAAATGISVFNATTITATTPAGAAGAKNVVVTTLGGTGTGTGLFSYIAAPTVTGISPTGGPTAGGTTVTITGTNLTGSTSVTIGGVAATGVTVVNATTITATTPASAAGAQNVVVTTPGGSDTGTGLFTYFAAPTVTTISPVNGPAAGGTTVTITGTNFTGATAVTIGGVSATNVSVVNATTIIAITPAGTAGARDVVVITSGGFGTGSGLFTYVAVPISYTVTGSVILSKGGTISCVSPMLSGSSSICTLTPATGWYIAALTDNSIDVLSQVGINNQYLIDPVTADHAIEVAYQEYLVQRLSGTTPYYYLTIPAAYTDVVNNDTIMLQNISYAGDASFDKAGISAVLVGGYVSGFGNISGFTILNGRVSVQKGKVMMKNIKVK